MKTPLELPFQEVPNYTFLKVFGCACWPHLCPYSHRKLEFRSKKCVFLGYSSLHKGYKCLHVPTNHIYISRDVIFDENVFPFSALPSTLSSPPLHSTPLAPDQFVDVAYSPVLLPNHGARIDHGALLELLDESSGKPAPVPTPHVASPMASPRSPSTEATASSLPSLATSSAGLSMPPTT
jgi:histone deacetylase 1/2